MLLVRILGKVRRWYHANDEIYLSDAFQRQRAQDTLYYYAHVWDPSSA